MHSQTLSYPRFVMRLSDVCNHDGEGYGNHSFQFIRLITWPGEHGFRKFPQEVVSG